MTERFIATAPNVNIHVILTSPPTSIPDLPPTLVFLHFWGGSSSTFANTIQHLSSRYPTISIDFRGWGKSTGPTEKSAYSMEYLASDVEKVLQKLDSTGTRKYVLVGHSMGGKVAQVVAGRKILTSIAGVVLVAPAPSRPLQLPEEMRETQIHAYDSQESAEFVVRNVLTASKLDDKAVVSLVEDMVNGSAEARAAWPEYGMAEDVMEWARNVAAPVLVVGAKGDQVEPVDRLKSEVCGIISNATLAVLEAGHLIPVERPHELAVEASKFVDSLHR